MVQLYFEMLQDPRNNMCCTNKYRLKELTSNQTDGLTVTTQAAIAVQAVTNC